MSSPSVLQERLLSDRRRSRWRTWGVLVLALVLAPFAVLADEEGLPTDRTLRVGFLIVDGVYNSELMAPYDIFHHTVFHTEPGMEVFTVSPDGEPRDDFEGLAIEAHYSFRRRAADRRPGRAERRALDGLGSARTRR